MRTAQLVVTAVLAALTPCSLANRDYTCLCGGEVPPELQGEFAQALELIYGGKGLEGLPSLKKSDMLLSDASGWSLMHHAFAADNIEAARVLTASRTSLAYPSTRAREQFNDYEQYPPPLPPPGQQTLVGLLNEWNWQPLHVAAAFNASRIVTWVLDIPDGLEAMILRRRFEDIDTFSRTPFMVAVDAGAVGSADAFVSHYFATPDVESMHRFSDDVFARARLAGAEMAAWYQGFVDRRRDEAAMYLREFYNVFPLPKSFEPEWVQGEFDAEQRAAWPPLYHLKRVVPTQFCEQVVGDSVPLTSRRNTFGPQNMFAGVPRQEIMGIMAQHDRDKNGILEPREASELVRYLMNRETGGVKELLGNRMPTRKLMKALALDRNGDGFIAYGEDEPFLPKHYEQYNEAIFEESIKLENRVIRTQQSARLSTPVSFSFSKWAMEKLRLPEWLDVQFQVINSIPPAEHYGHHDDGAHRIFTVFLYCQAANRGGATAFPFALAMANGTKRWHTPQDDVNIGKYRAMGVGKEYIQHVHLHEMCEVERDCCDPDCHAMHRGWLNWNETVDGDCTDDDLSLRANAISGGLIRVKGEHSKEEFSCKFAKELGLCVPGAKHSYSVRMICPHTCDSCDFARNERRNDHHPRVIPSTGTVEVFATPGDLLVWPNYEHLPSGLVSKLWEAGHCGCPVRGGEKWSANIWFKLPSFFLTHAMRQLIREYMGGYGQAQALDARACSADTPQVGGSCSAPPSSRREAADRALARVDAALFAMWTLEHEFVAALFGFSASLRRFGGAGAKRFARFARAQREGVCRVARAVTGGPVEALFTEALALEYTAFGTVGARRMYHFLPQFEWSELAETACGDDWWCAGARDDQCGQGLTMWNGDNKVCAQSCGTCGLSPFPTCTDANAECGAIAGEGECRDERTRRECGASCGSCYLNTALRSMEI